MRKSKSILNDVLKIAEEKQKNTKRVLAEILTDCESQLKRRADIGQKYAVCTIPLVKPGLPAYDVAECMEYVKRKLRKKGFDVTDVESNVIMVEWQRALSEQKRKRNKERAEEAHKKKKREREKKRKKVLEAKKKAVQKREKKTEVGLPPFCHESTDLFALPSLQALRSAAKELRARS